MKEAQRRIDKALSTAEKKVNNTLKQVQREQAGTMQKLGDAGEKVGSVLTGVFVGLAVAIPTATFAMLKLNSELNSMIARIGVFTGNVAGARDTLKELVDISLQTGVSLGAVEDVFGKISMNAKALGTDGQSVIEVTRGVAQAIAISGKPISEMAGALTQLGQAFASPIVQAEEFRSVFEGANFFANEIAKSILGPNGTAGALFQLVKKQKLTNKMLFIAIKDALPRINKQFGQMPLSLDRVINRFQLMGFRIAMAMEEFQKLEGPQKFLKVLDNLIEKTTNYLINNQALISSKMTEFFNNATNAVNALVFTYKLLEPYLPLLINGFIGITTALTAFVAITKAYALYQAIANAVMLASPTTWMIVGISALIGILAVLVMNWKSVTSAIQTAYAWLSKMASLVASFSMDKIGQLITLVGGGGVKPPAKVKPAMAQRQGAGTTNTSNKSLVNTNTFNFNGVPSNTQAKSLGRSFSGGMMNGFQALGGY
jgi:tape measure domain-containing protein